MIKIILHAGTVGVCVAFLWFLSHILMNGSHYIQEPSLPILIAEIVGISIITVFATLNLIRELLDKRHKSV